MAKNDSKHQLGELTHEFLLGGLKCHLLKTEDGSYTLSFEDVSQPMTEPMHSSRGAWSENQTIYAPAIEESLAFVRENKSWCVASVGLGLGYNEVLAAGYALQRGFSAERISIYSFESQAELIESFQEHFLKSVQTSKPGPLTRIYQDICLRVAGLLSLDAPTLENFVRQLTSQQSLKFYGPVSHDQLAEIGLSVSGRAECILFDAFSPASSPELWDEQLLKHLLETLSSDKCVFASYASRTILKRVLKGANFTLKARSGFAGKRESTFAVRNCRS